MRSYTETSLELRERRRDQKCPLPSFLALIIQRILPLGILLFLFAVARRMLVVDLNGYYMLLAILFTNMLLTTSTLLQYYYNYFIELEESGSRQEWLDALKPSIKDGVLKPGLLRYPRQKEKFAAYVAGQHRGMASLLYRTKEYFRAIAYYMFTYMMVRSAVCIITIPEFVMSQFLMRLNVLLWINCSLRLGREIGWNLLVRGAAEKIRRKCKSKDLEQGGGDVREQLEWWIKAILKEESDSDDLAEERMSVITIPILKSICC